MYLSRLLLNPRSRQVQREVGNPYDMHRTVMRAFPETLPEDERVLYRLDSQPRSGQLLLLVQSQTAPDWAWLVEQDYLLPADPYSRLENPAVKVVILALQPDQTLHFRLRANPTKRLMRDDPERKLKKGQRIGLLKEADQQAWLANKAQDGGFAVLGASITSEGFNGGRTREQHKFNHLAVRFDGLLQVTDPDQFLETLRCGLGRGKGFGFGLLSVAPA
jgi:CRISPR system Cascade subunit CasE